jgi:hypothetical protein
MSSQPRSSPLLLSPPLPLTSELCSSTPHTPRPSSCFLPLCSAQVHLCCHCQAQLELSISLIQPPPPPLLGPSVFTGARRGFSTTYWRPFPTAWVSTTLPPWCPVLPDHHPHVLCLTACGPPLLPCLSVATPTCCTNAPHDPTLAGCRTNPSTRGATRCCSGAPREARGTRT